MKPSTKCQLLLVAIGLLNVIYAQEGAALDEYDRSSRLLAFKVSAGTGSKYGGIAGVNSEFNVGIFGITAGCGYMIPINTYAIGNNVDPVNPFSLGTFGWQTGIKLYFVAADEKFRPSINLLFGNMYPYHVQFYDTTVSGTFIGFTPTIIVDHDIGKARGFSLSYGGGVLLHEPRSEAEQDIVNEAARSKIQIRISIVVGVNYFIY